MGFLRNAAKRVRRTFLDLTGDRQLGELCILRKQMDVLCRSQLLADALARHPGALAKYEFAVYSQNGEDGIIQEIFRRIGVTSRRLIEIGSHEGSENNTALLIEQGWQGLWIDGGESAVAKSKARWAKQVESGALVVKHAFLTAENVHAVIGDRDATSSDVDLLSIDIDYNTYWLWKAMCSCSARVVVVEYNAAYPPPLDWKIPYDPAGRWKFDHQFGASLDAFVGLGEELGYRLVGCDLTGSNAFFVRADVCGDAFPPPYDAASHYQRGHYWLKANMGHSAP
jgi:hypothetical protein